MSALEGRSLEEIGTVLHVAPDAAKSLVARSRRTLTHRLAAADLDCGQARVEMESAAARGVRLPAVVSLHLESCRACARAHRSIRRRRRVAALIPFGLIVRTAGIRDKLRDLIAFNPAWEAHAARREDVHGGLPATVATAPRRADGDRRGADRGPDLDPDPDARSSSRAKQQKGAPAQADAHRDRQFARRRRRGPRRPADRGRHNAAGTHVPAAAPAREAPAQHADGRRRVRGRRRSDADPRDRHAAAGDHACADRSAAGRDAGGDRDAAPRRLTRMPEFHSAALSVIHNDAMEPGAGPALHRHPYEEVFLILEGEVTFTLGDETIAARAGDFLIAPPGVPHAFKNTGSGVLRTVDVHASPTFGTEWL